VPALVYASSIAALGDADHPSTLYGIFKWANEGTAERYFEDYGVSSIGLRPHTVYGPGRDQGLTSAPTVAPSTIPSRGRLSAIVQPAATTTRAFAVSSKSPTPMKFPTALGRK
jgi:nucleoside-diphosphate-sugar epimerase